MSEVRVEADSNVPTWWQAEFPLLGTSTPLFRGFELIQRQGAHDIAVIPFEGEVANFSQSYATGAPVRLTWGNRYGQGEFVGYVHHTQQRLQTRHPVSEIICIGAGYPLLEVRQRAFEGVTADQTVSTLARAQGLGATVDNHLRTYPILMQDTISDWALLSRLAGETGYVLRVEGTTVQFVTRDHAEAYYRPRAQVYYQASDQNSLLPSQSTLFNFTPIVGDYFPETGATNTAKTVTRIDPTTGETLLLSRAPTGGAAARAFFTSPQAVGAHTALEAEAALEAAVQKSKYVYRAKASLQGSAVTAPERFVYLRGVQEPYGGYWTVLSVRHKVEGRFKYFCEVELGTDGLYGEVPLPTDALSSEMRGAVIVSDSSVPLDLAPAGNVLSTKNDVVGRVGTPLQAARWTSTVVSYA